MSDAIAAPQPEVFLDRLESVMTLEEVVVAIKKEEGRFMRLYHRFHELNGLTVSGDKRKQCNPIRDLKISANRAYQWARRAGCNADEARERAIAATMTAAETRYPSLIENGSLPLSVMAYIDKGYSEYTAVKSRKKMKRTARLIVDGMLAARENNEARSE
jgi:hypothetical protein